MYHTAKICVLPHCACGTKIRLLFQSSAAVITVTSRLSLCFPHYKLINHELVYIKQFDFVVLAPYLGTNPPIIRYRYQIPLPLRGGIPGERFNGIIHPDCEIGCERSTLAAEGFLH